MVLRARGIVMDRESCFLVPQKQRWVDRYVARDTIAIIETKDPRAKLSK